MEFRPYRRKLDLLTQIARRAGSGPVDDAMRRSQVDDLVALLHADRGTIYLIDEESGDLRADVEVDGQPLHIRLKVGQGLAGWVAMAGIPLVINNVLTDDRFDARWDKKSGYQTETVLAAPMLDDERKVIGVVQALNSTRGEFDDEDRALIEAVASICSLAERAQR